MRTLSKLQHEQFRDASTAPEVRDNERQIVEQQEKGIWRGRLLRLRKPLIIVCALLFVWRLLLGWGRSADGLATAAVVEVHAPTMVRVVEVYVAAGDAVAIGDPLVKIAPVRDLERDVLLAELAEAERRLALVQAGGGIDGIDAVRGVDRLVDAELALNSAETEWQQARVKARELERSRDRAQAALGQDRVRLSGAVGVLQEQLSEAEAKLRQAQAQREVAEEEALRQGAIGQRGAAAGSVVEAAYGTRDIARAEVASRMAAVGAVRRALDAAGREHSQDSGRASAALDALGATVDAAWLATERAKADVLIRRQVVQQRRNALPKRTASAEGLRSLEVERLQAEVDGRRARLAAHDAAVGRTTVRASVDGVVDLVHCAAGQVLAAGELVISYFDPVGVWAEVWVPPDLAVELSAELAEAQAAGEPMECTLVGDGDGVSISGHVQSVGRTWRLLPSALGATDVSRPPFYRQVRIQPAELGHLSPAMRLRVVF